MQQHSLCWDKNKPLVLILLQPCPFVLEQSEFCASGSKDEHLENTLQASKVLFIYFYFETVEIPEKDAQGCLKQLVAIDLKTSLI